MAIEAFPLTWPTGWRRTAAYQRTRAKFGKGVQQYSSEGKPTWTRKTDLSISQALDRVTSELRTMDVETAGTYDGCKPSHGPARRLTKLLIASVGRWCSASVPSAYWLRVRTTL